MATIIKDKVLVGHAIKNDLDALLISHPRHLLRDTSRFKPLNKDKTVRAVPSHFLICLVSHPSASFHRVRVALGS